MKLQLRIFVALLLMAAVTAACTHLIWSELVAPRAMDRAPLRALAEVFEAQDDESLWHSPRMHRRLRVLGRRFDVEFSVYDRDGHRLFGRRGPRVAPTRDGAITWRGRPAHVIHAQDGRALFVVARHGPRGPPFWVPLVVLVVVLLAGSYLLSRGITARLERMRNAVEAWGGAAEQPRVSVEGGDEVAALARSFNRAADRIEQLVEGQRRMLASASHELRTPMTRIRMASELMRAEPEASRRDDFAQRIVEDLAELDELVNDILTSARLEASEQSLERVDLSQLVAEEIERFDSAVTGQLAQGIDLEGVDLLLRRLIRNLLQNAFRYGGGSTPAVELNRDARHIVLRVTDEGPGIDPADQAHIFEPFFRAKDHHEGHVGSVGLGLYLVHQIARLHGGDVGYRRQGGTSVFEVRFPQPEKSEKAQQ